MTVRIIVLLLLFPAATTAGEARSSAVLPLQPTGSATPAQADAMRRAVSFAVVGTMALAEVDRKLAAVDATCNTARCLEEAGRLLEAERLVGGRVGFEKEGWTLSLWVFDTRRQATLATVRDQCGGCTEAQARDWAARVVGRLLGQVRTESASASLDVRSTPSGAEVSVDGTPIGVTDMTFGVAPGRHTVAVRLPGRKLAVREVNAEAGATVKLDLRLEAEEDAGPAASPALKVAKWATLGAAVVGLAAGIALIAVDGGGTCDPTIPGGECPELRSTMTPGVVLTAVGGAAALASGYLFYRDSKRKNHSRATVLPAGAGVTVVFRFR
jgi:hypothetical protein